MSGANFLVTGALGCLGAWIVRNLVQSGINVTIYDLGTNLQRLQLLMTDEEIAAIRFAQGGDITNLDMLKRTFDATKLSM